MFSTGAVAVVAIGAAGHIGAEAAAVGFVGPAGIDGAGRSAVATGVGGSALAHI